MVSLSSYSPVATQLAVEDVVAAKEAPKRF